MCDQGSRYLIGLSVMHVDNRDFDTAFREVNQALVDVLPLR